MSRAARELAAYSVGALAALALLAALYLRAAAVPEPMQVDEFSRVVRRLASDAHEAERLATASTRGWLTRDYGEYQQRHLGQDVSDALDKLDAPGPGGDETGVQRARALGARLAVDLQAARLR
ncbi:MAG: hypothetical protein ACM3SO_07535, partial [Betaproteobacteria bacterium]